MTDGSAAPGNVPDPTPGGQWKNRATLFRADYCAIMRRPRAKLRGLPHLASPRLVARHASVGRAPGFGGRRDSLGRDALPQRRAARGSAPPRFRLLPAGKVGEQRDGAPGSGPCTGWLAAPRDKTGRRFGTGAMHGKVAGPCILPARRRETSLPFPLPERRAGRRCAARGGGPGGPLPRCARDTPPPDRVRRGR